MSTALEVQTVDYHTAGEPFRIVVGGAPDLPGACVAERRLWAATHLDHVRRLLIHEPRGHADMYGGFPCGGNDAEADLGVVFFHNAGYSTACGHGTIALATWALDSGRLDPTSLADGVLRIDVPSGRVLAIPHYVNGYVGAISFRNVPAKVSARGIDLAILGRKLSVDIAFGGAYYVSIAASQVGLTVEPEYLQRFIAWGREIKTAVNAVWQSEQPAYAKEGIYGVIFWEDLGPPFAQRNITVFADGEVDRSPCGSGSSARLALLFRDGRIGIGDVFTHQSIIGTQFMCSVLGSDAKGDVSTEITGSASLTGRHTFVLQSNDELADGFLLR